MKTFEEYMKSNYVFYDPEIKCVEMYGNDDMQKCWEAAKPRWIPVSERLPDKDDKYLIKVDDFAYFETAWFNPSFGLFEVSDLDISSKEVTHWMAVSE